jgi:hypothetical protein
MKRAEFIFRAKFGILVLEEVILNLIKLRNTINVALFVKDKKRKRTVTIGHNLLLINVCHSLFPGHAVA